MGRKELDSEIASQMGRKGGVARVAALTRKQRGELASKAAQARWKDHVKKVKS